MPQDLTDDKSSLFQVMVWCRQVKPMVICDYDYDEIYNNHDWKQVQHIVAIMDYH